MYELVDKPKKQPNRRFLRSDLALKKKIMDCRTDQSSSIKRNLAFRLHDVINTKEQTLITSIKDAFKEKTYKLNIVFQATAFIFTFINTNLQLQLIN